MISTISRALTLATLKLKNRRSPVIRQGERLMTGLEQEAEIFVDRWGVPHVYARTLHDLYFLDGYVQAWDRLWQMDFSRRLAAGRVAEILGEETLPLDRFTRRIGFRRLAEEAATAMSTETQVVVEAFADGINTFITESRRLPLEFQALEYEPELWRAADILAVSMLVPFSLTPNWDLELIRALLLQKHAPEDVAALEIDHRADVAAVSSQGTSGVPLRAAERVLAEVKRLAGPGLGRGAGSNAWALAGTRTTTGKPLLAGDPHLPASMPNVWHQVHLSAGDIDIIGASIPGIPGVIIGHNKRCAWSVTAGVVDTSDLFVGNEGEGTRRREELRVRGGETVSDEVFIGSNGPDIAPALGLGDERICLKIVLPDADGLIGALVKVARAGSWSEFREALRGWVAPVLNFVYADIHGDIAYQLAGKIPLRREGKGLLPNRNGSGEWADYIPFDELPTAHNPESGYIITANQRPAGDDYPHWLGADFLDGYRAERIAELIASRDRHSPIDVSRMQMDEVSIAARDICAALSGIQPGDASLRPFIELLEEWDYRLTRDSSAACVYVAFVREFSRRLGRRRLGEDVTYWLGRFVNPLSQGNGWAFNHAAKVAQTLSSRPEGWFDDWDEEITSALRNARDLLTEELGDDPSAWRYGALHRIRLEHSLGDGALAAALNRGPYEAGGDGQCVHATSIPPDGSFDVTYLPGFRQVIDLSNLNEGHATMPGGQSGDPFSVHYNDLTQHWLNGRMHRQYFARTDVIRHSETTLRLLPGGAG